MNGNMPGEAPTIDDSVCLMLRNITKVYPGTTALKDVCYKVYKGKVNVCR